LHLETNILDCDGSDIVWCVLWCEITQSTALRVGNSVKSCKNCQEQR